MNEDPLTLPHNIDAEQALLGAILVNNPIYDLVASFLEPSHFYDALHARIYKAAGELIIQGRKVTPVTLRTYFEDDPALAEIGGPVYLAKLAGAAAMIISAEEYARTIHDLALRRDLIAVAEEVNQRARYATIEDTPMAMVESFDSSLSEILHGSTSVTTTLLTAGQAAEIAVFKASEAYRLDGKIEAVGLSSGLASVDAKLGPLEGGSQIIVAGATSMGKTAFAEGIALYNGLQGKRVQMFSQEMKGHQLARRWISRLAEVDSNRIRMGRFSEREYDRIVEAARRIDKEVNILIDEARNLNVRQIGARARAAKRHGGLDLLVVDYLQLLAPLNERDNTARQVAMNSKALRDLGGELDVPVLLVSQLNREFAKRENKRPQMQDLKESGSIEQDADAIVFIHREEYYLERSVPEEGTPEYLQWQEIMSKWQGKAEIIIPKLREGAGGGTALVGYHAPFTLFRELDEPIVPEHIRAFDAEVQKAMPL